MFGIRGGRLFLIVCLAAVGGCDSAPRETTQDGGKTASSDSAGGNEMPLSAEQILGNPKYPAFCYGGYRENTRDNQPTVEQLTEDLKILSAMGVKFIRSYNTQDFPMAENLLRAIAQLKQQDRDFEMYVMLGAWINCRGAWSDERNHDEEDLEFNTAEIEAAVELTNQYPDIVKVIAVGNEAMVHWATPVLRSSSHHFEMGEFPAGTKGDGGIAVGCLGHQLGQL